MEGIIYSPTSVTKSDVIELIEKMFKPYIHDEKAIMEAKKSSIGSKAILSVSKEELGTDFIDFREELDLEARTLRDFLKDPKKTYTLHTRTKKYTIESTKSGYLTLNIFDLNTKKELKKEGYILNANDANGGILSFDYSPSDLEKRISQGKDLKGQTILPFKDDEIIETSLYSVGEDDKTKIFKEYLMKFDGFKLREEYLDPSQRYLSEEEFEVTIPVLVHPGTLKFLIDSDKINETTAIGKETETFMDYEDIKKLNEGKKCF